MTTDNPPSAAAGAVAEDELGGEVVVQLEGIRKSFGQTEVLHGVDLTVHAGEHVVIFGPSGSGKSTVLRTINLLEEPSEGSVRVLGVEYGPAAPAARARDSPPSCAGRSGWSSSSSTSSRTSPRSTTSRCALQERRRECGATQPEERAAEALRQVGPAAVRRRATRPSSRAGSSSASRSRVRSASTRR